MSSSAQHILYFTAEATRGVTPATPPWSRFRHNAAALGLTKEGVISEEIHSSRQIRCFRHGTQQAGGDVTSELAPVDFDALLAAALCGTWAPKRAAFTASTISAASADNSINDSGAGFPAYVPGERVRISGFTGTVANNQTGVVVSRTASKVVLTTVVPLLNDVAGEAVTVTSADVLTPGSTRQSFTLMRHFTDQVEAEEPFHLLPGMEINTLALTVSTKPNVMVKFGFLGSGYTTAGTAPAGSTYPGYEDLCPFSGLDGSIRENGAAISTTSEFALSVENGMEPKFVLMNRNMQKPKLGRVNATGTSTNYFENATLLNKYLDETATSMFIEFERDGWFYSFECPLAKLTGAQPDVSGQSDIVIPLPFQAIADDASGGTNLILSKISAA